MALIGLSVLFLHLTAAAQGQTTAQSHLEAALRHYQNLEYELALEQLRSAQRRARSMKDTVTAMLYEGIILFELGQDEEGTAAFQTALRLHPTAKLPVNVSPKITQRFESLSQQTAQRSEHGLAKVPQKARLTVKLDGSIRGARLFIDSREVGTLPLSTPIEVEPGMRTIGIRRPGFSEFSSHAMLEAGKTVEVVATLKAVAGVVMVTADVPGVSVIIDGVPRGQAPVSGILLEPGSHELVFTREGYESTTQGLEIKAGKDYTVVARMNPAVRDTLSVATADSPKQPRLRPPDSALDQSPKIPITPEQPAMRESRPWFKRWYVWAGVGTVAGVAAVSIVVATQKAAFTPEKICEGPCDDVVYPVMRF